MLALLETETVNSAKYLKSFINERCGTRQRVVYLLYDLIVVLQLRPRTRETFERWCQAHLLSSRDFH